MMTHAIVPLGAALALSSDVSLTAYLEREDRAYVQPVVAADRGRLHFEARYNYEDLDTGSAWLGVNLGAGEALAFEIAPMVGGVFGRTSGFAPGLVVSLGGWKLDLYSEGEYVFVTEDSSQDFFYTWTELAFSPGDEFRIGAVTQQVFTDQAEDEARHGILVGVHLGRVDAVTYILQPNVSNPTVVMALSYAIGGESLR